MASESAAPRSRLVQGVRVPAFLYGTAWKEERTAALTKLALSTGFVGIDTANQRKHYVEAGVGEAVAAAIAEGRVTRADLFLQTKFTYARGQDHRLPYDPEAPLATQVEQSFAKSLEHLGTTYVDSLVLHGPSRRDVLGPPDREVWHAMAALQRAGKTRLLGVSNVALRQLRGICEKYEGKPAFVQNRCFAAHGWDRDIRAFCRENGILYQGFSLLTANDQKLRGPAVERIIARTGKTLAQVVFRFALQVGMIPLTGTSSATHMREDLDCFDFELDEAEVRTIETIAG
jgi:diketogulonate reductase-like aldo/keto reductase